MTHKAELCFVLPDQISTLEGALIEPLAVGFHAALQGGAKIGQTAIVFGAGCIGLMSLLAMKACSVSKVYVVDVVEARLAKALELGADGVINGKEENVVERAAELTAGEGFDLAIETAGSEVTVNQAIQVVCKGAHIVLVGYSKNGMMNLMISLALDKELQFDTVFRYRHIYPMGIEAVAQGKIPLKKVACHIFDFDDIQTAMDRSVKALLMDAEGVVTGTTQQSYGTLKSQVQYAEQDMEHLWEATKKTVAELAGKYPGQSAKIQGISFSGQMHRVVRFLTLKSADGPGS